MFARYFSIQYLLRLILVCWGIMMLGCYPLWHGLRDFPVVPVWEGLLKLPWYLHDVFFYASLVMMALLLWRPQKKWALFLLLLMVLGAMLDQNRWQPWHYQFMWMLAAFGCLKTDKQVMFAWQIILVAVYFYSGYAKMQPAFIHDIWRNLFLHSWLNIYSNNEWVLRAGYVMPLLEMGLALMLLFKPLRKIGVIGLILMHGLLLLWLGPFGVNIAGVIIAWNFTMPILLIFLFYMNRVDFEWYYCKKWFFLCLGICCCCLPFLSRWGYWDRNLSFVLYSGGVTQLYICTDNQNVLMEYGKYMSNRKSSFFPCKFPIPVYQWGYKSLLSDPNSEERIFAAIVKQWKQKHPGADARFYLYKGGFSPKLVQYNPQ
jgi:hypothetical protein